MVFITTALPAIVIPPSHWTKITLRSRIFGKMNKTSRQLLGLRENPRKFENCPIHATFLPSTLFVAVTFMDFPRRFRGYHSVLSTRRMPLVRRLVRFQYVSIAFTLLETRCSYVNSMSTTCQHHFIQSTEHNIPRIHKVDLNPCKYMIQRKQIQS